MAMGKVHHGECVYGFTSLEVLVFEKLNWAKRIDNIVEASNNDANANAGKWSLYPYCLLKQRLEK